MKKIADLLMEAQAGAARKRSLIGVIEIFNAADVSITSLEILEPNLETVFLHLTGKRLRD